MRNISRMFFSSILVLLVILGVMSLVIPAHASGLSIIPSCILANTPQTIFVLASGQNIESRTAYWLLVTLGSNNELIYRQIVYANDTCIISQNVTLPPLNPGYYTAGIPAGPGYTTALVVGSCPIQTITTVVTTTLTNTSRTTTTQTATFTTTVATVNATASHTVAIVNVTATTTQWSTETDTTTITNTTTEWTTVTSTTTHYITYTVGPAILTVTPMNYSIGVVTVFAITGKGFQGNETVDLITPSGNVQIPTDTSGSFVYTNQWTIYDSYFDFHATGEVSGLGSNVVTVVATNPQMVHTTHTASLPEFPSSMLGMLALALMAPIWLLRRRKVQ